MERFDHLVIGGGIAGLSYALNVAEFGTVAVLFKGELRDSSTWLAQGGIAAVQDEKDRYEFHIEDTLVAGAYLCNEEVVSMVVRDAPARIQELVARGANFDTGPDQKAFDLHREGGHSMRRILHCADATGAEILRALLEAARAHRNIKFFPHHTAIDLITTWKMKREETQPNRAVGAYVLKQDGTIDVFAARKILVATGGAGKIYRYTTNPDIATGDGIAMCFRAGVPVSNLEFYQFHPTCLFHPLEKSFLITEAMRGEGAILRRINGEPFMKKYDERAELAPRDTVARAIDNEMKLHGEEHVLLDITHRPADFIRSHFPMIHERCLSLGLDITKEPIPVVPAAHYCCGGVVCNMDGETGIENLFVAGECSSTGLHGANRLASNSLLEGLVYAHRAAEKALSDKRTYATINEVPDWNPGSAKDSDEDVVITQTWGEIRRFMWNYVGIVRSDKRLERALRRSNLLQHEIREYYWNFKLSTELVELRNLNLVSNLVIHSAMMRKESRGLHYNVNHPNLDDRYKVDTVIRPDEYFHYRARL